MSVLIPTPPEISRILPLLAETPRRIATTTSGLEASRLSQAPEPHGWSALQVLTHLRACAELWGFSIFAMLAEKDPVLTLPDGRRWAKAAATPGRILRPRSRHSPCRRSELLEVLGGLDLDGWGGGAQIDGRRHTIYSQAQQDGEARGRALRTERGVVRIVASKARLHQAAQAMPSPNYQVMIRYGDCA